MPPSAGEGVAGAVKEGMAVPRALAEAAGVSVDRSPVGEGLAEAEGGEEGEAFCVGVRSEERVPGGVIEVNGEAEEERVPSCVVDALGEVEGEGERDASVLAEARVLVVGVAAME